MSSVLGTYLGWEQPQHLTGCRRPEWEVSLRREEDRYRSDLGGRYGEPVRTHKCPDAECGHGNSFDRRVVRIVCHSCGQAQVITGEATDDTGVSQTSTARLGYGLAPRKVSGLLLWPGKPWMSYGRANSDEPYDFVVTRAGVTQVTKDAVVGDITQGSGRRGGVVWAALAVPDAKGQFGYGGPVRYAQCNDGRSRGGSPLRTVRSAARWIADRLTEADGTTGGGE